MKLRTHYQALGVEPTATPAEIRRAYRAAARAHHPDTNPAPGAAARFAQAAQAYAVLAHPARRSAYDALLGRNAQDHALPLPSPRPHYSWRNIATDASPSPAQPQRSELDEMYDAFFGGNQ